MIEAIFLNLGVLGSLASARLAYCPHPVSVYMRGRKILCVQVRFVNILDPKP